MNMKMKTMANSIAMILRLLNKEIRDLTILSPVVSINEDLFLYMDQARSRLGGENSEKSGGWKIQRFEVKFGSLLVGAGGSRNYGLPLNFQTVAENVALIGELEATLRHATHQSHLQKNFAWRRRGKFFAIKTEREKNERWLPLAA